MIASNQASILKEARIRGYGRDRLCYCYKIILLFYWHTANHERMLYIRIEKHLQCEKLLGLARGNTKKHGNKNITPIRYNVLHMYIKL